MVYFIHHSFFRSNEKIFYCGANPPISYLYLYTISWINFAVDAFASGGAVVVLEKSHNSLTSR